MGASIRDVCLLAYAMVATAILLYIFTSGTGSASLDAARNSRAKCKIDLVHALENVDTLYEQLDKEQSRSGRLASQIESMKERLQQAEDEAKGAVANAERLAEQVEALREADKMLQEAVDSADASRDAMRKQLLEVQTAAAAAAAENAPQTSGELLDKCAELGWRSPQVDMDTDGKHTKLMPAGPLPRALVSVTGSAAVAVPVGVPIDPRTMQFRLPKTTKRVWFDVGAHRDAMYTLPFAKEQEDLLVFAFEPLYRMWAELAITHAHPRVVALPAAVAPDGGVATFHMAGTDQCSSLKPVDPETDIYDWPGGCTEVTHAYQVPVLSLQEVLDALPLPTVQFVKIDAQGADFDVLLSAGPALAEKVENVVVEVQTNVPLYAGAKNETDFVDYMADAGFDLVKRALQGPNELNLLFHNAKLGIKLTSEDWDLLPLNMIFDGVYEAKVAAASGAPVRVKKGSLKVKDRDLPQPSTTSSSP
ncbi:uncharacterized protein AMSG_00396 [Thecamonas trahens ATCC 50062]|uniref:Methyltransferase FkbM domain-containing protein n=1 Tax=Thecamonas trahens ATCC 50062 TaxID=461836 RepID=A0A0L0D8F7_THETB|nr:hypothetical protein AMSG_00396 [Thecamonas trahens ATCC 50062]KNC48619.1 hypothetical protein AMSG_00396 [Thecamonas trahens ATCC 50062]|eukprot:XP_013762675.1 hypothetical protein AMSG_00396 [Thecamonas trahens ATCC 50062]